MNDVHNAQILLIEDEVDLAELVRDYLLHAGYEVSLFHRGDGMVDRVRDNPPDLILLDLNLPGVDGLTICREVREFSDLPIIMVTAQVEEIDRLLGLELGADDYICKPFKPREVVARCKAVLRRTLRAETRRDTGLTINNDLMSAALDGHPLDLTQGEFRLLAKLAEQPGRVFSRDQLLDVLYDDFRDVSDRAVDTHIKNLRRKLGAHARGDNPIRSVYGVGYKLEFD